MKKNYIKPSILPGFMELLPKEQTIFNDITKKIVNTYEQNGCLPIDTPIIEKSNILLSKTGGETEKQVYRFEKGKNDLSLRFDLTVPFARYVSQHYNELVFPFTKYQLGKVYRGERNQRGRYREFYQLDVDVIGKDTLSIYNDAWVISLASKAFQTIGLKNYKFKLSNRKLLKGILQELEIENSKDVMILIDKYDKMGESAFNEKLKSIIGEEKSKTVIKLISFNTTIETLNYLSNLKIENRYFEEGLDELKKVVSTLKMLGIDENEFDIDLKIIRGLDYYTGSVFETFLVGNESYGSICSGGRYANLAETYTNNILPGVGISIGLTRLFFVLKEIGFIANYKLESSLDFLIILIDDNIEFSIEVMVYLQSKGYSVKIYFEDNSLKKKMSYANKLGAKSVIFIGENETNNRKIKVKDMTSGKENIIDYKDLN